VHHRSSAHIVNAVIAVGSIVAKNQSFSPRWFGRDLRHGHFGISGGGGGSGILAQPPAAPLLPVFPFAAAEFAAAFPVRISAVVSAPQGFGRERGNKDDNSRHVFHRANIVEEKETQKERRGFASGTRNTHGQSTKLLANGGRTGGTKETHGTEQKHDGNLARHRPAACFQWSTVEVFLVRARLRHPNQAGVQVSLDGGGRRDGHQGNGV